MLNNTASKVARDTSVQHFGSTSSNVDIVCFIHTLDCHSEAVWQTAVESLGIGIVQPHGASISTRSFITTLFWMTINTWMEANTMRQGYMG